MGQNYDYRTPRMDRTVVGSFATNFSAFFMNIWYMIPLFDSRGFGSNPKHFSRFGFYGCEPVCGRCYGVDIHSWESSKWGGDMFQDFPSTSMDSHRRIPIKNGNVIFDWWFLILGQILMSRILKTRRRMARERRGTISSSVNIKTIYHKTIY